MKKSIYFMLIAICCSLAACKKGDTGPAGADGKNGINGTNGKDGNAGPTGPAGPKGATGPAGPQGSTGATGPAGPTGPQGPTGATGPAGPSTPPNVKIQTLTILPGQWQISGTNGYGFSINPAVPYGGAIAYFNTTGPVNDYEALPYSDGNFSINVITDFNTAMGSNVALIYKDSSDRTRRPATNIYIKLVTFSGINANVVKAKAGSLGFNDVARFAERSSKQ